MGQLTSTVAGFWPHNGARRGRPSSLEAMSWGWLNSPAVFLVGFIAALIGIPPSVAATVAFVRPVVRRAMSRRAKKPAAQPAPTVLMGASPSTSGPSRMDGPYAPYASYVAVGKPLTTITSKSVPEWYEVGLGQPAPSGEPAKGGVPVYPGGL